MRMMLKRLHIEHPILHSPNRRVQNVVRLGPFTTSLRHHQTFNEEPLHLRRIRSDIERLKVEDEEYLLLIGSRCRQLVKWLETNIHSTTTIEQHLKSAGPRDYIPIQATYTSSKIFALRDTLVDQLWNLQAHCEDLRAEPYPEYELDKPVILSKEELKDTEVRKHESMRVLKENLELLEKYSALMKKVAAEAIASKGATDIPDRLEKGVRDIRRNTLHSWVPGTLDLDTPDESDHEEFGPEEDAASADNGWADHSKLMDDDISK